MGKRITFIVLVVVIVTGAVYSYKRVDFGGKTTIFFKIVFGDESMMMKMPPKVPMQGERGAFKPPTGFKGEQKAPFGPGARGDHGSPRGKGMHGKPGMGKVISLRNVIPYTFILAFFILITRVFDVSIRKMRRSKSSG
jgi:hypothetical protein